MAPAPLQIPKRYYSHLISPFKYSHQNPKQPKLLPPSNGLSFHTKEPPLPDQIAS